MQTAGSKVELAVLHVIEAEPSSADMGAMCERNPLHTFMFDAHGKLLNANKAAFEAFQSCPPGITPPLHQLGPTLLLQAQKLVLAYLLHHLLLTCN